MERMAVSTHGSPVGPLILLKDFLQMAPLIRLSPEHINGTSLMQMLGLRLPLNFSGGKHYRFLTLAATFNDQQLFFKNTPSGKPENQHFNYVQGNLTWNMQVQQAVQHIFPRFAHTISVQQRTAIGNVSANQFLASGNVYLPGIITNP